MIKLLTQDSTGTTDVFYAMSNILILLFVAMNLIFIADASVTFFAGASSGLHN